ncbi:IucA/IucC family protein [Kangiella sp. M94]
MFDSGANCFLNALVREFESWQFVDLPAEISARTDCREGYCCQLNNQQVLYLPLIQYSRFGRSYFHAHGFIVDDKQQTTEVSFDDLLANLANHPEVFYNPKLGEPDQTNLHKILQRAKESQHNILKVVSYRGNDLSTIYHDQLSFIESEQSLLVGHSIHPCPKSRSGFSELDEEIYVPEYGNSFQLSWFAVSRDNLYVFAGNQKPIEKYCEELIRDDFELTLLMNNLDKDYLLIPCHPWQAKQWLNNPELKDFIDDKTLVYLGDKGKQWRATSSLRSLYQEDSPWMLKFSLTTQLTNSIRHLQPEEMIRGQVIEKVLSTQKAQQMEQELDTFSVMREPISIALQAPSGKVLDSTAIIWRQNPFYKHSSPADNIEVLSGLLQDCADSPDNRLSLRIRKLAADEGRDPSTIAQQFLEQFLQRTIRPIIVAQAKYGLLFGAHQQNIVLQLDEQLMPIKTYFRDCQGTGFSTLSKELYGEVLLNDTASSGNLFEDDMVIYLFAYYLMVNACFNTISSLTLTDLISEEKAQSIYRDFLLQLKKEELPDPRVVNYLLTSTDIWSKGNFFCNLHAINENTMTDPFAIYHKLNNPLLTEIKVKTNAA